MELCFQTACTHYLSGIYSSFNFRALASAHSQFAAYIFSSCSVMGRLHWPRSRRDKAPRSSRIPGTAVDGEVITTASPSCVSSTSRFHASAHGLFTHLDSILRFAVGHLRSKLRRRVKLREVGIPGTPIVSCFQTETTQSRKKLFSDLKPEQFLLSLDYWGRIR
jgi:hypothetical protein